MGLVGLSLRPRLEQRPVILEHREIINVTHRVISEQKCGQKNEN